MSQSSRREDVTRTIRSLPVVEGLIANSGVTIRVVSVLLAIIAWQLYAMTQPTYLFPTWDAIFQALVEQFREYGLLTALGKSLLTLLIGYGLAVVTGIVIGLSMGLNELLENVLNPWLNALYVAPVSAMVPIFILIGGSSLETRVFVVFLFAFFEIAIDTYEGVKTTPQGLLKVARSFGADRSFVLRKVIIPNDLPYILTGLRLGIGRAIKGLILAELLIQFTNLGAIIRQWQNSFRLAGVLSIVMLLMILGILATRSIQKIQDYVLDWQPEAA